MAYRPTSSNRGEMGQSGSLIRGRSEAFTRPLSRGTSVPASSRTTSALPALPGAKTPASPVKPEPPRRPSTPSQPFSPRPSSRMSPSLSSASGAPALTGTASSYSGERQAPSSLYSGIARVTALNQSSASVVDSQRRLSSLGARISDSYLTRPAPASALPDASYTYSSSASAGMGYRSASTTTTRSPAASVTPTYGSASPAALSSSIGGATAARSSAASGLLSTIGSPSAAAASLYGSSGSSGGVGAGRSADTMLPASHSALASMSPLSSTLPSGLGAAGASSRTTPTPSATPYTSVSASYTTTVPVARTPAPAAVTASPAVTYGSSGRESSLFGSGASSYTAPAPSVATAAMTSSSAYGYGLTRSSGSGSVLAAGQSNDYSSGRSLHTSSVTRQSDSSDRLTAASYARQSALSDTSSDEDDTRTYATPRSAAPALAAAGVKPATNFIGSVLRSRDGVACGLVNLGNTCFMAAAIQCLAHTLPLAAYFVARKEDTSAYQRSGKNGALLAAFADLMREMWTDSYAVAPRSLKVAVEAVAPIFRGWEQQDTHEFMRVVIDALHEAMNMGAKGSRDGAADASASAATVDPLRASEVALKLYRTRNKSIVSDLFAGQLCSMVRCSSCKHVSYMFDAYMDLSLPLPITNSLSRYNDFTLDECMRAFAADDVLQAGTYRCERCNERPQCTRNLRVARFPPILVLHLKRFTYGTYGSVKLSNRVSFPLRDLDVSQLMPAASDGLSGLAPSPRYDLFAVAHHSGSAFGGHYTAHARAVDGRSWYLFNDSRVSPSDGSATVSASAYVLYYVQRDFDFDALMQ